MKTTDEPVVVEQSFNSTINEVWNSITDVDKMRQWYFENIPAFKPVVGFETKFNVQSGGRDFPHLWKITEVIPQKVIKYNWRYENYPGNAYVTFELSVENNLTKLRLTLDVVEDFPEDIPEFTRESCIAGWQYFINDSLKNYLEAV